jgi:hypothetical protein
MESETWVSMITIDIGRDFSDVPFGRYPTDSPVCGEVFREKHLVPALATEDDVTVKIDSAEGYGSSFLEEAFGGLIRNRRISASNLEKRLTIALDDQDYDIYRQLIWKYIREAA